MKNEKITNAVISASKQARITLTSAQRDDLGLMDGNTVKTYTKKINGNAAVVIEKVKDANSVEGKVIKLMVVELTSCEGCSNLEHNYCAKTGNRIVGGKFDKNCPLVSKGDDPFQFRKFKLEGE